MGIGWVDPARGELLARRAPGGSWGYRDGGSPAVEPTALAGLALIASGGEACADRSPAPTSQRPSAAREAAAWLAGLQREDGSLPAAAGPSMPGWATPYAMLLWGRLAGFADRRRRARHWLLSIRGQASRPPAEERGVLGHDPTLIGWPWVAGTHSWLEPTAMAILAVCGDAGCDHPRVKQGLDLIRDRAIPGGGWNYGNNVVFGRALRPSPGPPALRSWPWLLAARAIAPPSRPRWPISAASCPRSAPPPPSAGASWD